MRRYQKRTAFMATNTPARRKMLDRLVEAVRELSAEERREFLRRLGEGREQNGAEEHDEAPLREAARAGLPTVAARRLKRLIAKSERGELSPQELVEYQDLARKAQEIDATRALALAERAPQSDGDSPC
jgi:hypothetical protein